ncbi:MAG: hypothetical protein JSV86_17840 [Gemmatimonadota bacterium]|nr:MAG: hypothetical protein JSV86_17840 [Gemmatimonadota bacterium]
MASRRAVRLRAQLEGGRDRWRRWVILGQGVYYVLIGLWPLLHFSSFARFVALQVIPFQAHALAAVLVVVGASLIEAARRETPGPFPTLLGMGVAGAIAVVGLFWLPRMGVASGLWVDLVLEVACAAALVLLYPRPQPERGRRSRRH